MRRTRSSRRPRDGRSGTMKRRLALAAILVLAVACTSGSSSEAGPSGAGGGVIKLQMWHGQTDTAAKAISQLVDEFNASHPDIQVTPSSGGTDTDGMLPKVTTAIAAGTYPDIAYMYGSWGGNLATSPAIADITNL